MVNPQPKRHYACDKIGPSRSARIEGKHCFFGKFYLNSMKNKRVEKYIGLKDEACDKKEFCVFCVALDNKNMEFSSFNE